MSSQDSLEPVLGLVQLPVGPVSQVPIDLNICLLFSIPRRQSCFCLFISLLSCLSLPAVLKRTSLVIQIVKNLPVMQGSRIRSLGWEEHLEKGIATHYSIAWKNPRTEEPGGL